MSVAAAPAASPPLADSPSARKRPADGENAEVPRKKKTLMGRTLGSELEEVDNNAVSNASKVVEVSQDKAPKKNLFGRTLGPVLDSSPPPSGPISTENTAHFDAEERDSLPTPPNEDQYQLPTNASQPAAVCEIARTTNGKRTHLTSRRRADNISYEQLIAQRSETAGEGRAQRDFYGINIHKLIQDAENAPLRQPAQEPSESPQPVLPSVEDSKFKKRAGLMWTEKYRAKKFTDLVGDERTHRHVLRWLKAWDPIVFPGMGKAKVKQGQDEYQHRKILLLTGPPGLGKTTLAHVCAKQAGYEIVEVNASDERSRDVVKNKIRDCVGTENVRGVNVKSNGGKNTRRPGKPVCLIVDEVDGVVSGNSSGGGEGGFMKALIDLVHLDQRNSRGPTGDSAPAKGKRDKFKLLRPLIMVCNDVYHPSLRPLRAAGLAEIVHVRKPALDRVIERIKHVFEAEGVACDADAARRLCEHTWGVSNRKEGKTGAAAADGDMRSILVVSEWAATKLRAISNSPNPRLTKNWIDAHITSGPANDNARGHGRGGVKEAADRVFRENAGFTKSKVRSTATDFIVPGNRPKAATDITRHEPIRMLRDVVESTGDFDRVVTEIFSTYPNQNFQDDNFLTKPNAAYEWLYFHDCVGKRVFSGQEWELIPYQSTPAVGFHYLFGSSTRQAGKSDAPVKDAQDPEEAVIPFSGPRADFEAREASKETKATIEGLQKSLSLSLHRMFISPHEIAVDLLPQLIRMLTPNVKPVVVGGKGESMASVRRESEKDMVRRAIEAMGAVGAAFERLRIDDPRASNGGWIYRMEPALDSITTYETLDKATSSAPSARYAVRQIMDQEHRKFTARQMTEAAQARFKAGGDDLGDLAVVTRPGSSGGPATITLEAAMKVKRDFFGRIIKEESRPSSEEGRPMSRGEASKCQVKVWVSFNEGFSNAVRKPISLKELLDGL